MVDDFFRRILYKTFALIIEKKMNGRALAIQFPYKTSSRVWADNHRDESMRKLEIQLPWLKPRNSH